LLSVIDTSTPADAAVHRRDVFRGLLAFAAFAPIASTSWAATAKASFIAPTQLKFLEAFVDTLIPATDTPGAAAAQVHLGMAGLIDRWASAETRAAISAAITTLQTALDRRANVSFVTARATVREAALAAVDREAFASAPAGEWRNYRTLKTLAVRLYYTSEIGVTLELRYDPLPGAYIGDLPFKAGDRSWAL